MKLFGMVLVAAGVVAVASSGAVAAPCTHDLDAVIAAVTARTGATKAEKKALAAAKKLFAKKSSSFGDDVSIAAGALKALEKGFPGDAAFGAAVSTAGTAFNGDGALFRDALTADVNAATNAKAKAKAQKHLDKGNSIVAGAVSLTSPAAQFAAGAKAFKEYAKARSALPVVRSFTAKVDGVEFTPAGGFSANMVGEDLVVTGHTADVGGESELINVSLRRPFCFGTFPLTGLTALYAKCPTSDPTCPEGTKHVDDRGGEITITAYDAKRKFVEGTFHFVAEKQGDAQSFVTVTEGTFRLNWRVVKLTAR